MRMRNKLLWRCTSNRQWHFHKVASILHNLLGSVGVITNLHCWLKQLPFKQQQIYISQMSLCTIVTKPMSSTFCFDIFVKKLELKRRRRWHHSPKRLGVLFVRWCWHWNSHVRLLRKKHLGYHFISTFWLLVSNSQEFRRVAHKVSSSACWYESRASSSWPAAVMVRIFQTKRRSSIFIA